MTPYYEQDGIVIYHGESAEILPCLPHSDLLLTDPPYGLGEANGKNKSRTKLAVAKDYGVETWDDHPAPQWLIDCAVARSAKAIIWGGNYYTLSATSCWLVWDKENGNNDFADCELAWTNLDMAVRKLTWRWNGMLQEDMGRKESRMYPTQKPLALMKWCLGLAGGVRTVIDPFMGSGTTLRAAKDAGISAIGIDRREQACEIAAKRMAQQVLEFAEQRDVSTLASSLL